MLDWLKSVVARKRQRQIPGTGPGWRAKEWTTADDYFMGPLRSKRLRGSSSDVTAPYSQNAWVYAAIDGKSRAFASAPFRIMSGTWDDRDKGQPLPSNDPWQRVFAKPNPFVPSASAFWKAVCTYLDLYGEAFLVAFGDGSAPYKPGTGAPREILLVSPTQMTLQPDDVDTATGLVLGWTFNNGRANAKLTADQVGQIRLFNPDDPYRGLSPLAAAMNGIRFDHKAQGFNVALLDNGCDPGGILTMKDDDPGDDARRALRDQWENRHKGSTKAGRTAILWGGMTYSPLTVNQKELQFPQAREWSREEIKAVIGVTDSEMGQLSGNTYANAAESKRWLWENSILPRMALVEDALRSWLWAPANASVVMGRRVDVWGAFDTSAVHALTPQIQEQASTASTLISAGFDGQDVADKLGLDLQYVGIQDLGIRATGTAETTPGGGVAVTDKPTAGAPVSVQAPGSVQTPGAAPTAAADAAATGGAPVQDLAMNGAQVQTLTDLASQVAAGTLSPDQAIAIITAAFPTIGNVTAREIVGHGPSGGAAPIAAPSKHIGDPARPLERKAHGEAQGSPLIFLPRGWTRHKTGDRTVARQYIHGFQDRAAYFAAKDIRNAFRRLLERAKNAAQQGEMPDLTPREVDLLLGAPEAWRREFEAVGDTFKAIAEAAVKSAARITGPFRVVQPDDPKFLLVAAKRTAQLVRVGVAWRERIRQTVIEHIHDDGLTVAAMAESIQAKFGSVIKSNGMVIARTETAMIGEQVRHDCWKQEGYDQKIWDAVGDAYTRESHQVLNGESKGIDERFSNGLLYPCEPGGPAEEVIQCRCTSMPSFANSLWDQARSEVTGQ